MFRRALAHISPEELVLIPLAIVIAIAVIAQPTAITRLFESPYATSAPGEAPAERLLREGAPSPTARPAPAPSFGPTFRPRIIIPTERPRTLIAPVPFGR